MGGTWELITVTARGSVIYCNANKSRNSVIIRDFIQEKYPDISLDKKDYGFEILLSRLLKDGWEPFSVVGDDVGLIYSFRRMAI